MTEAWEMFKNYSKSADLTRIRISDVPVQLKEAVKLYRAELSKYLADPENESIDSLGPNEMHNAMLAVKISLNGVKERKQINNCSRCGGTGYILAFSHIKNGKCLSCNAIPKKA